MALLEDIVGSSIIQSEAIKAAIKVISKTNHVETEMEHTLDLYVISSTADNTHSMVRKTVKGYDSEKQTESP